MNSISQQKSLSTFSNSNFNSTDSLRIIFSGPIIEQICSNLDDEDLLHLDAAAKICRVSRNIWCDHARRNHRYYTNDSSTIDQTFSKADYFLNKKIENMDMLVSDKSYQYEEKRNRIENLRKHAINYPATMKTDEKWINYLNIKIEICKNLPKHSPRPQDPFPFQENFGRASLLYIMSGVPKELLDIYCKKTILSGGLYAATLAQRTILPDDKKMELAKMAAQKGDDRAYNIIKEKQETLERARDSIAKKDWQKAEEEYEKLITKMNIELSDMDKKNLTQAHINMRRI